ncbi:hypothetical protein BHM03_00034474 [Ensete ventricosum]|nr:hypothetical protein BHM03_00034474 [Ensete ventricosum]
MCLKDFPFLQIDEDILQEVIKMGFDKNQLVESLHSRIQNEVFHVISLQELNVSWKKIGHYNLKCRYTSGISDHAESMLDNSLHANHSFSDESAIVESDDVAGKESSIVKFEIQITLLIEFIIFRSCGWVNASFSLAFVGLQLYKTREDKYLLDLQRVSGPHLLFLDLCAAFLAQLRVL